MERNAHQILRREYQNQIPPGWGYGLAVVAAGVAFILQRGLYSWLGEHHSWSAFYLAIMVITWWVGWRPALVTAGLGLLAGIFFLMPPQGWFQVRSAAHWVQVWTYAGVVSVMILLIRRARREQAFSAVLANSLPGLFYLIDDGGQLHRWNRKVEVLTGYSAKELDRLPVDQLIVEADRAAVREQLGAALANGEGQVEVRILTKDGRQIPYLCTNRRLKVGRRHWLVGMAVDLSERQRAEEQLRQSREMLALVLDTVPVRVFWKNLNSVYLGCNRAFARDAGLEAPDQLLGKTDYDLTWHEQVELYRADDRKVMDSGQPKRNYEEPQTTPEGGRLWLRTNKVPLRDEQGRIIGVLGTYEDITERKEAELKLLAQTRRLGLLSEAAARLLSAEEPSGVMADLYEQVGEYFQIDGFFELELSGQELRLASSMGLGAELGNGGPERKGWSEGLSEAVARERRPLVLGRIQESNDPQARLLRDLGIKAYACYPLTVAGRLLGTLGFVSRQREGFETEDQEFFETLSRYLAIAKERKRLVKELHQYTLNLEQQVEERTASLQESLAELEHMSYSIIHDLRAPLRAMIGYAQILLTESGVRLDEEHQDFLQRIMASANRMDLLITDALSYNKAVCSQLPLEPVDPAQFLRGMLRTYPEFQPPAAEIELEGKFPWVVANQAALTQCFSNLLNNAVKFVAPGQTPKVRIWAEPSTLNSQPSTIIYIQDNGIGIPREAQKKLFAMFQRLHGREYGGTGIGLALVRKVTERMGGRVGVESEPGHGSRFWVELRSAQAPG